MNFLRKHETIESDIMILLANGLMTPVIFKGLVPFVAVMGKWFCLLILISFFYSVRLRTPPLT